MTKKVNMGAKGFSLKPKERQHLYPRAGVDTAIIGPLDDKASVPTYQAIVALEACSKANSRRLVWIKKKPRFLLSKQACEYTKMFDRKTKVISAPVQPFAGDVSVEMKLYYSNRRKDLDESLVLDVLQGRAYINDRQVKEKIIRWGLDKSNPRCEIIVREIVVAGSHRHSPT